MKPVIPPSIRVFISSTFADMEKERHHFSTVIMPKLKKMCSARGVSVFSVDLRWGITYEDQINGQVLPICLKEIDRCRPFFIGILGNRYGSIVNQISDDMLQLMPWLREHLGKSVTELEMLYGALDAAAREGKTNCCFLMRQDAFSRELFPMEESAETMSKLACLKDSIRASSFPSYDYGSMAEFEEYILTVFASWLDQEFPSKLSAALSRRNWFNSELLRNYMEAEPMDRFLDRYCSTPRAPSLLICGYGERGKTTLLTHWQPPKGAKILINCGSDEVYHYWPAIAQEIIRELCKLDSGISAPDSRPNTSALYQMQMLRKKKTAEDENQTVFYPTDKDLQAFRKTFLDWLEKLELREPVCIVINDLNLLGSDQGMQLNWLPADLPENLTLICSVNSKLVCENAQMLGWNIKEMPLFSGESASVFMDRHMGIYGKKLNDGQKEKLLSSRLLRYPGYLKFVVRYLNIYGRFDNLDEIVTSISAMTSVEDIYLYILTRILDTMDPALGQPVYNTLYVLAASALAISEDDCYGLVSQTVQISSLQWSDVRLVLDQFGISEKDQWLIENAELISLAEKLPAEHDRIHVELGEFYQQKLTELGISLDLSAIKSGSAYAKAVLHHFAQARQWQRLCEGLKDRNVLFYLTKLDWKAVRVAWMKLLFYSDIDVARELLTLFVDMRKESVLFGGIQGLIAGLLADLEQNEAIDLLQEKTGVTPVTDSDSIVYAPLSQMAVEKYKHLAEQKSQGQYQAVYGQLIAFLEDQAQKLNIYDKCLLLAMKADCELTLKLYDKALLTANSYYLVAIQSMYSKEIMSAVDIRGTCLYFTGRPEEALDSVLYAKRLAYAEGKLRPYLSMLNIEGMCYYRRGDTEKSLEIFDEAIRIWEKLGNIREVASVAINRCNALSVGGQDEMALAELKKLYESLQAHKDPKLERSLLMVLSNIGGYSQDLGLQEEAEQAFREVIERAKAGPFLQYAENSYVRLIQMYEKQNMFGRTVQLYEALLELLYNNHNYERTAQYLKKFLSMLSMAHYEHKAIEVKAKWTALFAKVPGGPQLLEGELDNEEDAVRIDRLRDKLILAESEGDWRACAQILCAIALQQDEEDNEQIAQLYAQAAEYYTRCEEEDGEDAYTLTAGFAMMHWVKAGMTALPEYRRLLAKAAAADQSVLAIYEAMLEISPEDIQQEAEERYTQLMLQLTERCRDSAQLTELILRDQLEKSAAICSAESLNAMLDALEKMECYQEVLQKLAHYLADDHAVEQAYLTRDYTSSVALKKLSHMEKTVAVLKDRFDADMVGCISGNLALIFRRRQEEEKTIAYHKLAMEKYQSIGKIRDCLIETMNLATAYREFGRLDEGTQLLRSVMQDEKNKQVGDIYAAVAGNLAGFLTDKGDMKTHAQEVIDCFRIEEDYFRATGEERELAISLFNQIRFYLVEFEQYESVIREKYAQAMEIAQRNNLREFAQHLRKLDTLLNQKARVKPAGEQLAQPLLDALLRENKDLELLEIKEQQPDYIYAVCNYRQELRIILSNVHIRIDCRNGAQLQAVFLLQPRQGPKNLAVTMTQYTQWWNEQGAYELEFNQEDMLMLSRQNYGYYDWDEASRRFRRNCKLWMADVMNAALLCMGVADLDEFKKLKLEAMKKTEE